MVPRSVVALVALGAAAVGSAATGTAAQTAPSCAPGGPPVELAGLAAASAAKSYLDLPFEVADGTTRIEMTYDWTDPDSVLDLGLWDPDGVGPADGFRGWSGSRGGRVTDGQAPVFVQPDEAARGYVPGPIESGTWNVDLGLAALGPEGTEWTVTVVCTDPAVGPDFEAQPVDPDHVANREPGVYYGDFHMHGYHSNANAPTWDEVVSRAEGEGLDIVFATDYVTGQHWAELGPVQEAHPDVLVWPGREIITYFGHANALGETPSVLDFRHGAPGVSLADIQRATVDDGALFQVNHPTIFPEAAVRQPLPRVRVHARRRHRLGPRHHLRGAEQLHRRRARVDDGEPVRPDGHRRVGGPPAGRTPPDRRVRHRLEGRRARRGQP